jgi:hypothetical protein
LSYLKIVKNFMLPSFFYGFKKIYRKSKHVNLMPHGGALSLHDPIIVRITMFIVT